MNFLYKLYKIDIISKLLQQLQQYLFWCQPFYIIIKIALTDADLWKLRGTRSLVT
jgi:hypothetical protein